MYFTPSQATRLTMQTSFMLAEANMVIAMRMWGMAGMWNISPVEIPQMLQEKAEAGMQSAAAASTAMMKGSSAAAVAMAALKPVRRRTRDNVKRLTKRGPFMLG